MALSLLNQHTQYNLYSNCMVLFRATQGSPSLGEFIKSVWDEYQVWKREYKVYLEEFNVETRELGFNILYPLILMLLGRISSGGRSEEGALKIRERKSRLKK